MATARFDLLQNRINGVMFISAPVIFSLSTFFWENGEYGPVGATLIALSAVCWVPVMYNLFGGRKRFKPGSEFF